MRFQRRILHIRWHDYIPNNKVLRRTSLLAASSIVRKRRLALFGHVTRLADDIQANRILRTCCEAQDGVQPGSDWRCARGRPPTTWTLPRHGSYGDRRPATGRRPIVLATNYNGGKLRLNASRAQRKGGRLRRWRPRLWKTSLKTDSAMNFSCERLDFRHMCTSKKFLFYMSLFWIDNKVLKCVFFL